VTTPNELYAMTPESTNNGVHILQGYSYDHVPELGENVNGQLYHIETDRIEIRFLKDWSLDGRRIWRLATVWFDNKPVMIIQNAGREGDDHAARFVTDANGLKEMCVHVKELFAQNAPEELIETVNPDGDIDGLTEFYGNRLDGYFEKY